MTDLATSVEYGDRAVEAAHRVLVEIGQVLGTFRQSFTVIGGSVPHLLFPDGEPEHIGTIDVDLGLDHRALSDNKYVTLVEALEASGYERGRQDTKPFQLRREVDLKDGNNRVSLQVASAPAFLVMKGCALADRNKPKDAYDIYYTVLRYGAEDLAKECRPLLRHEQAANAFRWISEKFEDMDSFGPDTVRRFLADAHGTSYGTLDELQADAFFQVRAWADALFPRG